MPLPAAEPALLFLIFCLALQWKVGKVAFSYTLILILGIKLKFRPYFSDTQVISSLFLRHILGALGDTNFLGHEIWHGSNQSSSVTHSPMKT